MNELKKRNHTIYNILIVVTILLAAVPAVSAFTAELVSPAGGTVYSGDVIKINIGAIAKGETFAYRITSSDLEVSSNMVSLKSVDMPFGLDTVTTTIKTTGVTFGVEPLKLSRDSGAAFYPANTAGTTDFSFNNNIPKGKYDLTLTSATTPGNPVTIDYKVTGKVDKDTAASSLSLTLTNVNTGTLTIEVPDASPPLSKTFTIQKEFTPLAEVKTETLTQTGGTLTAPSTIASDTTAGFTSELVIATGTTVLSETGVPVTQISVTPIDPDTVPAVTGAYSFSGLAVEYQPSGTKFTGGSATVSFALTDAQWADALNKVNNNIALMKIQNYDPVSKSWVDIPTTVDTVTHTVSATITHFSLYGLSYGTPGGTVSPDGGSGGDNAPGAPAAAAAPASPQAQLAPPGISATSVTLQHNEEGKVLADYVLETDPAAGFSSALEISTGTTVVSAAGKPVGQISVTPLEPESVPDAASVQGGTFSGLSVDCAPSGTRFVGGSATISFSLTPAQWAEALVQVNGNTAAMTIQFYDTASKTWAEVPTTVDPVAHTVSARVTHFSTYALFYKTTKVASPQTFGDLVTPTPAATTTAGAPAITPAKTMRAPTETTKSPGLSGIVVIGVVGFVGLYVMRKKQ